MAARYFTKDLFTEGALGYIRNRKTEEKIIQNRKTAKKKAKTENRILNRKQLIQWWQVGHTEQTIPPRELCSWKTPRDQRAKFSRTRLSGAVHVLSQP